MTTFMEKSMSTCENGTWRSITPAGTAILLLYGTLYPHLLEVDEAAQNYLDTMIPRMAVAAGVTEELKARDQLAWVGRMNAIRAQVDEMIKADLIYC